MAEGLIVYGDHGRLQIDSRNPNIIFKRKLTLSTTAVSGFTNLSYATVSVASDEIVAYRCASPAVMDRLTSGGLTFTVAAAAGQSITFYVFGKSTSAASFGLNIYNANKQIVFCSADRQFRAVGVTNGNGSFNYGGTLAVVAQAVYARLERSAGGVAPTIVMSAYATCGAAQISGSTVTVSDVVVGALGQNVDDPNQIPSNWSGIWTNSLTTRYVVLDVTGY